MLTAAMHLLIAFRPPKVPVAGRGLTNFYRGELKKSVIPVGAGNFLPPKGNGK